VRLLGIALAVTGLLLAVRAAVLLAGRGRPRRGPTPAFIIAGPYVRMRNPLLAGLLLALTGVAVARGSWLLMALAVVGAIGAHAWVTCVEEPRLAQRFGAAYAEYLRRVPRWLPGLREDSE
jgi:protein-S-isoprenylcysteine O-methyltransferase Ste14